MKRSKIDEAREILTSLGLPRSQRNVRSGLVLLALANVGKDGSWKDASRPLLRIWDMMGFMRKKYGKIYAANSRETVRRQTIHQFEHARIVDRNPDDPSRPTNSDKTVYALTNDVLSVIQSYGSQQFDKRVTRFIAKHGSLQAAYQASRSVHRVALRLPQGETIYLSPGAHNKLQVAVIEQFGPRFAGGASVLYVGDTAKKHVVYDNEQLAALNIPITKHDKLPDVVLYHRRRKWLFLIEAVTSHGPMSPKRHREIEKAFSNCPAERIYVTAFPNMRTFRRHAADIAWETEVWVADIPDHMIHFNGPKFLGPYKPRRK